MDLTEIRESLQDIRDVLIGIYSVMSAIIIGACLVLLYKHGVLEKILNV